VIRDDLTSQLVHLTKGNTDLAAAQAFCSIFSERKLRGGTGCIKGGYRCVCFSEAPIGKLAHILANPSVHGMPYKPFGVMVRKEWLFENGGRTAIYQPDDEFELLHETQRFRHKQYEPPRVDFTWEREWRVCADELDLDPAAVTLVVPTRAWERWAQDQHLAANARMAFLTLGLGLTGFPWHFVVLEDLGVPMPPVSPPD